MRMNDQQDTSMVVRKPSRDTSTTRPCSASLGENAIEWTTKSSLPQSLAIARTPPPSGRARGCRAACRIGASSSRASGWTYFLAFSLR